MANWRTNVLIIAVIAAAIALWLLRPTPAESHYGAWSLLPAVFTIVICFLTRNVLLALFLGIFSGGLIIGQLNVINEFFIPSLGSKNYAQLLLVYLWALGGLLWLWNRNGGARYFAET